MKSQIRGLRVAGTVFGVIGLAHVLRLLIRPEVLVAGYQVPLWPSALAVVVMAALGIWTWKLSWAG